MTTLHSVGWGFSPDQIEDSVRKGLEEVKIETGGNKYITFRNIRFDRKKDAENSTNFKDAVINKKSILTKIQADVVEVIDGKEIIRARKVNIGNLPQLIKGRNTFVVNGTEYNLVNQLRRNSASYVSKDKNNETYAEFNLAKGRNFSIEMDAASSLLYVSIGTSKILLKTLADAVGIAGFEFKDIVGDKLYKINWENVSDSKLNQNYYKLYGKLYEFRKENVRSLPLDKVKNDVAEYFSSNTKVDPNTTNYLYGVKSDRVDKNLILETMRKFINVHKGKDDPVDVDDLYYQKLYTPNLLFKDRLERLMPEITQKLKFKLKRDKDYGKIFKGIVSKPLVSLVNSSNLARLDPQYNPFGIFASSTTVTPMGLGGINDIQAVRRGARGVHTSTMGVIDPIATPQGQNVGVQQKLVDGVKVDDEGNIHIDLKDKKGKIITKNIGELFDRKVLLPGQDRKKKGFDALHKGKIVEIESKGEADYEFANDTGSLLNDIDKLIPNAHAVQGNRNYMSYRFVTQALPLVNKETPHVLPVDDNGKSVYKTFREKLGSLIPYQAPVSGTVKKIKDNKIFIEDKKGEMHEVSYHKHLPFATNTGVHQRPLVRPGYKVKKGDMILSDPYTDKEGNVAFGTNLRSGFTPYYGYNAEDAVVVSESATEKLTSVHYYKFQIAVDEDKIVNKERFRSLYGDKYKPEQLEKLDDEGVIKLNTKVDYGDILIGVVEKRTPDDKLGLLGKISKDIVVNLSDSSEIYNKPISGEVIDVAKSAKLISVTVKTFEPATVGDKVSGLYGNKGVIAKIVPDDQMLQGEDKKPLDILWSSTVVVSRINPAQVVENALGKVVEKTGEKYEVPILKNPTDKPLNQWAEDELKKHNVNDKEKIYDPVKGKYIKNPVAVGSMYTLKLLKGDKDLTARGVGPYYTSNKLPAKGGKEGAKAAGKAEFEALVSHNARNNLAEMAAVKGQYNPEFWKNFELGMSVIDDKPSFAWDSFKTMMTAGGGYIKQTNKGHEVIPLTDKLTNELAEHRTIKTPALLKAKSLEPIKEGLYDPVSVGGLEGKLWAKINLNDGIISPLMTDYVRLVLNKKKDEFKEWQSDNDTKTLKKTLDNVDTKKILDELTTRSRSSKGLTNNEVKIFRFLSNLKKKDMKLSDMVITSIPVPPPVYRPIIKLEDGNIQMHDLNHFYKDVMLANEGIEGLQGTSFAGDAKKALIDNIDALVGKIEPLNIQLRRKGAKGILSHVGGVGSPKRGFVHSTLIKKNQDLTGRARIIPDAKMDMDTIGLPEQMAWKIYKPHIRKSLIAAGYPASEADKLVEEHNEIAKQHLSRIMEEVPVWYNRAPTLHRKGFLAAKPKLVNGNNVVINMHSTGPLNADFDGDTVQIHAPVTNAAIRELDKFYLSKLVFDDSDINSLGDIKLTVEAILGFYQMGQEDKKKVVKDIEAAVGEKGLPLTFPLTKKNLNKLLLHIAKTYPNKVNSSFTKLKLLGEDYATEIGSTVGLEDIRTPFKEKNALLRRYKPKLKAATNKLDKAKVLEELQKKMIELAGNQTTSDLTTMVRAGAKGKSNQLASMITSPTIAYDPDRPLDTASLVEGNFSEGLDMREMWELNAKARKDLVSTSLAVATPGMLNKLLVAATNREVISTEDCGTKKGIWLDSESPDVLGRVLQQSAGKVKRGTAITTEVQSKLPKEKVYVRSPETCAALEGICQKCYGVNTDDKSPEIGTNIGIRTAHSISMPLTQMALDSKHGGRSITKDIGQGGMGEMLKLFSSDVKNPEVAVVARDEGIIENIETLPSGMRVIFMEDGDKYNVHRDRNILVKPGDYVEPGTRLSDGVLPFTDVTQARGIKAGRQALSGEIKRILSENGQRVHGRMPELLAKAAINYVEFQSPWEDYIPGDVLSYNKFRDLASDKSIDTNLSMLQPGMSLGDEYLDLSVGHKLTSFDIEELRKEGIKKVKILPKEAIVKPVIKSLYTAGLADEDWINNMGNKYIKRGLIEAAAEGDLAPEASTSPLSKWMQGRKMKTEGKYY